MITMFLSKSILYNATKRNVTLKAGLCEEKLILMPYLRTLLNVFVLNALCSKAKQLRIFLIHGIRPDFLSDTFALRLVVH